MSYKKEVKWISAPSGLMKILILNRHPERKRPGVLWIHGGGYSMGMPEMVFLSRAMDLVKHFDVVVISPAYRLSGEAPYPAALEDCYTALKYLKNHAEELGVSKNQIMVGGESAGGGLTAALCMYARDRGEVNIAYQMPLYPMIDDRDTASSRDNHAPVWNTRRNHRGWDKYLSGLDRSKISPYAAPARQEDFSRLPPAYTFVGDIEPFYCETLSFVEKLRRAGVDADVDVYPGRFHAFDVYLPMSRDSHQARDAFIRHFAYAAEHYFADN